MKFESIIGQAIDERMLTQKIFTPILRSSGSQLSMVSTETRFAIERYILDFISRDLIQIKLEVEKLDSAHYKVIEEADSRSTSNFQTTFDKAIAIIDTIILQIDSNITAIKTKDNPDSEQPVPGEKINQVQNKLSDLKTTIKTIKTQYNSAKGHITDAMSENARDAGCSNIGDQLKEVKNLLTNFNTKLSELFDPHLGKGESNEDAVKEIWINLLIDAISLLKINDTREKVHVERMKDEPNLSPLFEVFNKTRRTSSYGVEELVKYFDDFIAYESVLYGMNKYYRDHKKHVLQVWALGVSLMENASNKLSFNDGYKFSKQKFQADESKMSENKTITQSETWAMWTIIALCHDLGYPIEKTSEINKQAKKIISHFGSMQFTELDYNFSLLNTYLIQKFLNIISSRVDCKNKKYSTSVQEKYKDKLSKSLEDYRHGIFSSLLLFKNLTYFQETDYSSGNNGKMLSCEDARQFYIRKEILRSIAGHTCPKLYHIRLDTIAFLLILCDELQEWNRPRAENLLNLTKEEPPTVKIKKFVVGTKSDNINISMFYDLTSSKELQKYLVIHRFKHLHYLLRSGKDDDNRKFIFTWEIGFKDVKFVFNYDSSKFSYEQLVVDEIKDDKPSSLSLYD